jgi:hypothetical protein
MRAAGIVLAMLAFFGIVLDLTEGLPFTRSLPGWSMWLVGIMLSGLVYAVAEVGVESIWASDMTSDPLPIRLLRLVLGLSFVAGLAVAVLLLVLALAR